MRRGEIYLKNVMVQIFRDHWDQFKGFNRELVDEHIEENVRRMMGCSKVYIDKWISRMRETIFKWIKHRHR